MVTISIVDNDESFRHLLIQMLQDVGIPLFHLRQYSDGADLLRVLEQRQSITDLIFLDVKMPVMNGLEAARRIRSLHCDAVIIFISKYPEYVFDGYDVRAFHFLTKPLDKNHFLNVLKDAVEETRRRQLKHLTINKQNECFSIPLQEIIYMESSGRILTVHTQSEAIHYYEKISRVAGMLQEHGFFQIHRCCLVNLHYIRHVNKADCLILLQNGNTLGISRRRISELMLQLLERH